MSGMSGMSGFVKLRQLLWTRIINFIFNMITEIVGLLNFNQWNIKTFYEKWNVIKENSEVKLICFSVF